MSSTRFAVHPEERDISTRKSKVYPEIEMIRDSPIHAASQP